MVYVSSHIINKLASMSLATMIRIMTSNAGRPSASWSFGPTMITPAMVRMTASVAEFSEQDDALGALLNKKN